jgi:CRISPR-associated endonuclease/helicase Cas3
MADRSVRRNELIREMERLYSDRAYSDIELAERLEVNRSTVYRTRMFMETHLNIPLLKEDAGRYRLDRKKQLGSIHLSQMEALALYLGGRRLQQQTRIAHKPTATALEKLANVLRQPMMGNLVRAAQEILEQEADQRQAENLEQIVEGWTNGRKIRVRYRKPHAEARVHMISPYQLEPSVWGDSLYLIGHSDHYDSVITLKLSRIERVTVTMEPFAIPDTFDSHAMLEHAWGIWHADGPAHTVRLRFSAQVTPRVKENIWHPSQTVRDLPDGSCEWVAQIAEWREMEPWVRGWGAEVEVLAPDEMRESVAAAMRAAAQLYREPR